jgi:predicted regulator of amino acid metabolism with ACT domain
MISQQEYMKMANKYGLRISGDEADKAIALLMRYVAERQAVADRKAVTDVTEAIKFMDNLYQFKEQLQKLVKSPVEKLYDAFRFTVIPNIMDEQDIVSMTVEKVGRCNLQDDVQVKVEDKDALHEWLVDEELEDMISETVNSQTLTSCVRQRIKEGKDIPSCLKVSPVVRAVITRSV